MPRPASLILAAFMLAAPAVAGASEVKVTLSGSRASMVRQNRIARDQHYSFLSTPTQVLRFVDSGELVPLSGNGDYAVIAGYPFARPIVRLFVERLAADYRRACSERLVVTSLTRPATRQPRNASPLSVHPAGMAVDLRVSSRPECLGWLKQELLTLEERGLLDATLERSPPHFHVAVFPGAFTAYDQSRGAEQDLAEAERRIEEAVAARAAEAAAAIEMVPMDQLAAGAPSSGRPLLARVAAFFANLFHRA